MRKQPFLKVAAVQLAGAGRIALHLESLTVSRDCGSAHTPVMRDALGGFDLHSPHQITAENERIARAPFDGPRDGAVAVVPDFNRAAHFAEQKLAPPRLGRVIRPE